MCIRDSCRAEHSVARVLPGRGQGDRRRRKFEILDLPFPSGIPAAFAGNLRYYKPDFVVLTSEGIHYIVATKGLEDTGMAAFRLRADLVCAPCNVAEVPEG